MLHDSLNDQGTYLYLGTCVRGLIGTTSSTCAPCSCRIASMGPTSYPPRVSHEVILNRTSMDSIQAMNRSNRVGQLSFMSGFHFCYPLQPRCVLYLNFERVGFIGVVSHGGSACEIG